MSSRPAPHDSTPGAGRVRARATRPAGAAASALALALCAAPAAQPPFPPGEAAALELKQRGDYRGASRAFVDLLRSARGDARAAALAEYHAVMAFHMGRQSGDLDALVAAFDEVRGGPLARAHPTLADHLARLGLEAAAATGDVERTASRTRELGFLTRWFSIGPFDNERGAGFARVLGPETEIDLDASYDGKKRPVRWRRVPVEAAPQGRIDLDAMMRPNDQVLCYAATCLESDGDQDVVLRVGSDEAFAVFLNGVRLAGRDIRRTFAHDQDAIALPLRAGPNLLLLKVCEQEGGFEFAARLTSMSGAPVAGVRELGDEEDLRRAASTRPAQRPAARPHLGALTVFADAVAETSSPQDAFRLAYLLATSSPDDPSDRRDHRLALLASERMPDSAAARYLLAYTRIRRDAIAAEKEENTRRHDYQRILEADPDHAQALLALAQMDLDSTGAAARSEAGLRRALQLNPDFVPARLTLARALAALDLPQLAAREIALAGREDPAAPPWPEARRQLGRQLLDRDDLGGAERCWSEALARDFAPRHALELADLQLRRGRRDAAVATLELAIRAAPFARAPRLRLAQLLEAEGELGEALARLRGWLAICPEDDDAIVHVARLHGLTGDGEHQREALLTAVELNPNRKVERRHLEFLEADEKPFHDGFELDGDEVLAADPGPPADAAAQNDPYCHVLRQRFVRAYRNGTTSEYRHSIVRILTEEGARRRGSHVVQHHWGEQRARLLEVRVLKPDGQVLRPRMRGYYVKLPPLEVGDVLEIRARIDDIAPTYFGDYFGLQHGFAPTDGAPCNRSVLTVSLERGRDYRIQSVNGAPAGERSAAPGGDTVWTWEMRGLRRAQLEERKPSWIETEPLVRITTYTDWNHFTSWWWNLIRKETEISPAIRAKVAELTDGLTRETEKIAAIYDFITTEIRYTAWEFGVHGYQPYSTPVIFERRHGDCKDKALLLNAMLSVIGIDAYPVLIRLTDPRSAEDLSLAMVEHFNHCISYVPPRGDRPGLFLDGTATYHPYDTVPVPDQGASVLIVKGSEGEIASVDWTTAQQNRDVVELDVALTPDGDARVEMVERPQRNHAVRVRAELGNEPAKRAEKLERRLARSFGKVEVKEVQCSDLLDMAEPVELKVVFETSRFAARQDDGLLLEASLETRDLTPLVRAERRELPLLLSAPESQHSVLRYLLPEGYAPVQIPPPTEIETRFGNYRMSWSFDERELRIERSQALTTHRIEPAEYPEFRDFAISIDQADRQVVVVRREGR